MLNLCGARSQRKFPGGLSRRDFLTVGALGAGLTLADLLRLRASGAMAEKHSAKAVILIHLVGGPSHLDMYDMKPDAPAEYRGEFKPIQTNVPGMQICEHMPRQAQLADKFSIVNGIRFRGPEGVHDEQELVRGVLRGPFKRPMLGAVVSRALGSGGRNGMPRYVSFYTGERPADRDHAVYLGKAHEPFPFPLDARNSLSSFASHPSVSLDRLGDRTTLLRSFDHYRRDLDKDALAGFDEFQRRALEMISTNRVRDAFDLNKEDPKVRAGYGKGDRFLLARRLVEAGVSVVTVSMTGQVLSSLPNAFSWDNHSTIFSILRANLPLYDQYIHALLTDLHERGLDKDVIVLAWGEMGRTPVIGKEMANGKLLTDGRGHWLSAGSALLAGGGIQMGQVVGDTGLRGDHDRAHALPYGVQNVLATVYRALGIDPSSTLPDHSGRPIHILDDPEPIKELL